MPVSIDGFGSVDALAVGQLLELHEHQIPDLDETIAVSVGTARWPARNVLAMIVEDFRAWTARAQVAHLPEVVGAGDAQDARLGQPGDLLPQLERLIIVDIDGSDEPVLGQAEFPGDEVPGELDGSVLEIIAKRKITQHLEERVVPRGVADIIEVIVLAARAHAFLRGHRPLEGALLDAGEHVLELHHAGVGEHKGRIVARNERRRRHDLVAVPREIVEEALSDVVDAAHVTAARAAAAADPA